MNRKRLKQYLMLLLVIGVVAVVASGGGTFASFSAEVTNPSNTFATGTLFLHDTKNGGTTCTSESSNDNLSASPACDTLFTVSNLAANATSTAELQLTNAGSVNAVGNIQFKRSPACVAAASTIGTLTNPASDTAATLDLSGLTQAVVANTVIKLTEGGNTATFRVDDPSVGPGTAAGVNVTPLTTSGTHTFTTGGTTITFDLAFVTPALCTNLTMYVDELDAFNGTSQGCVWPTITPGTPCASGNALSALPSAVTSIGLSLNAASSRFLRISVLSSGLTNSDMATQASFGLLWHIEH